ncbi:MAG TPA: helix-turn-helix domain-containing protein [Gemmataceae bacterium]|nr:helix-turn-helix domain-containing protein [Gemmataceae bacterium]
MGRHKTISDDAVLLTARDLFRAQGHTVTTREIAEAAGISEAILYQRFGSKDELFFAAMHATGPDIDELLGPRDPPGEAQLYLRAIVVRMGKYFAGVIPLALRVMTHPSFDPAALARMQPRGPAGLQEGLAERLASLARRKQIALPAPAVTARLLVSLAHDWALGRVLSHGTRMRGAGELRKMVGVLWNGIRPRGSG